MLRAASLSLVLGVAAALDDFPLATVDFASLAGGGAGAAALHALSSVGALAVTGIPGFAAARHGALAALPACKDEGGAARFELDASGRARRTLAARSAGGARGALSPGGARARAGAAHACAVPAAALRAVVDMATATLLGALDDAWLSAGLPPARMARDGGGA